MSEKRIEQGQINWIGNKTNGTDTSNERHEALALPGERANTATFFLPAQRPAGRPVRVGRKEVGTQQKIGGEQ